MILILTDTNDDHAFCVQEALRDKGSDAILWFTADLAQLLAASVEVDEKQGTRLRLAGPDLHLDKPPQVVWMRRRTPPILPEGLHSADHEWARKEYDEFRDWLLQGLSDQAFWVNSLESNRRARSKLAQQQAAQRAGLQVPPTLYSNDPEAIRAFVRTHGGQVVYKALAQSGFWKLKDEGLAMLFTALLTEDQLLDDQVLRATPGIYQPCLPKAYELRVTVIGRYVFPAKVSSQSMKHGTLDWRRGFEDMSRSFEPIEISPELTRAILRLMKEMDLVFGCLDFIVTPQGEHVFLEVNSSGQFLFVEEYTGIPMLDAFCEMLIQGRPDFTWEPSRVTLRLDDFEQRVAERKKEMQTRHLSPPEMIVGDEREPAGGPEPPAASPA